MMNQRLRKKPGFAKNLLAAVLAVGAASLASLGLTQAILAAEMGRAQTVPTSYPLRVPAGAPEKESVPRQDPGYTLVDNDLEYYRDKKPTGADLSREEAARLGVRGLETVFGLDMSGKTIEMAYNPAENGRRAYWEGVWWVNGPKKSPDAYVASYSFSVDAVSGGLRDVSHGRILEGEVDTGFDEGLAQNAGDYASMARELAVKLGAIADSVRSVEYEGQGYGNNDPDIFFNLTGVNGDRAQLRFSRHDKALLGVTYDMGMQEMDMAIKEAEQAAKRAEEYFRQHPDAASYEE